MPRSLIPPTVEAQHPDPWIGKSQEIRLWNILVLGPGSVYVGMTGHYPTTLRILSLLSGPEVIGRNIVNYRRLEEQRRKEGRPASWLMDPKAVIAQSFRVADFMILGPLMMWTGMKGRRALTPGLRRFSTAMGVVTIAYNLFNYLAVRAGEKKLALATNEEESE